MSPTRKIVRINEEKCDGCGICVPACAEGALQVIDGKARLVSEIYCDGLGDCLDECPQGAITIEEREAAPFDEEAVKAHLTQPQTETAPLPCGCPGSALRSFAPHSDSPPLTEAKKIPPSQLGHWPIQLMLIPPGAPFLTKADILICADCVPFIVPDFHFRYLAGHAVLVGCPKLDNISLYRTKLEQIFRQAAPKRITVLRMEVPCCAGLANAVEMAWAAAKLKCPLEIHIVGINNNRIDRLRAVSTASNDSET
ncbi:4Fe-4S binding protein [Candidatus Acetothermia bacterium]|nr:4Fe-4S binding protein [Candidatus Acetothermia bacterium]MCI2426983.1 4Fe-4S binding protein [Candidatus Acetothermia bacterium]MCI2428551.1 4Fe-4S binding protein [Candidatus Acetothermia bacterium]